MSEPTAMRLKHIRELQRMVLETYPGIIDTATPILVLCDDCHDSLLDAPRVFCEWCELRDAPHNTHAREYPRKYMILYGYEGMEG